MSNWQQIDKGYRVDLSYRLASPDGIFDLNLILNGSEGKDFVGRQWQISTQGNLSPQVWTTYGRLVLESQDEARRFADSWVRMVQAKRTEQVLKDTIVGSSPPETNKVLIEKGRAEVVLGAMLAGVVDFALWDAAFDALLARNPAFFKLDKDELLTEDKKKVLRAAWKLGLFFPAVASPLRPKIRNE